MNVQRVARLIRLAEAPEVIQQAVTPGLWVDLLALDGTASRERRRLDLTVALAAIPLYRHHERVTGTPAAQMRTERLLVRAAKGEWTRVRLEEEVRRAIGAGADADGGGVKPPEPEEGEPVPPAPQPKPRKLLFRDKGDDWMLYPKNISPTASRDELGSLLERLRGFASQVERVLAAGEGSIHR